MRYIHFSRTFAALAALLLAIPSGAQVFATTNDLGTLGGRDSSGIKVNNSGMVFGQSNLAGDATSAAFVFDGNTMTAISLGGRFAIAVDLNEAGQAVGYAEDPARKVKGFLYHNGEIETFDLGGSFTLVSDVNEVGQVVGYAAVPTPDPNDPPLAEFYHAFIYDSATDTIQDLNTLGGDFSYAFGINDAGQVIGESDTTDNQALQAFRWSGGNMMPLVLDPGGFSSVAAINSLGQVAGTADFNGNPHAFFFDGAAMTDIGTLGGPISEARGLNDSGVVIGNSGSFGFYWSGGLPQQLTLGGSFSEVVDINNAGQILGNATTAGGANRVFRFTAGDYLTVDAGGATAFGVAMNEAGDFIGMGRLAGGTAFFGFRYDFEGVQVFSLGGSSSTAKDINENGAVTGQAWTSGDAALHAYFGPANEEPTDITAPVTSASLSTAPNAAGWNNTDVTLNLSAMDELGGSGVKEIHYTVGTGTEVVVSGSSTAIAFNGNGIFSVQFFAVDNAGNTESAKFFTVNLDKTLPTVSVNTVPFILEPPNNKMRDVTVSGSITDSLSGIVSATYWVQDEYGMVQPSGSVTVNPGGAYSFVIALEAARNGFDANGRKYTIFVKGVDAAGNEKMSQAAVVVPH